MPLHDHFHGPMSLELPWDTLHSSWASDLARGLNTRWLQRPFRALEHTHAGAGIEIDIGAMRRESPGGNGTAVAILAQTWTAPPALLVAQPLEVPEAYEVRVFEGPGGWNLVGAIELVSPGNKDRGAKRDMFLAKCLDYVAGGACVVVVDVITERRANLHNEIVARLGADALTLPEEAHLYAATYRPIIRKKKMNVDVWVNPLQIGEVLPTMPLRVVAGLFVPVELEDTYVAACRGRKLRV